MRTPAEQRFNKLAKAWKSETELVSNVTTRILHPTYQKIIGMGEAAIPLILKDLRENGPDDWFWALTAITDENPITKEIAGDMAAMTEAWLQWGKNAGYLILQRWVRRSGFPARLKAPIVREFGWFASGWKARPTYAAL